jgi:hypothetical protein
MTEKRMVRKRNNDTVEYDGSRIRLAISKAMEEVH